jgi:transcriptional regulator with PAS, ATPase and Fis domain
MLGESVSIRRVVDVLQTVAPHDVTVLLRGETGTGKEVAARLLHEHSHRNRQPFIALNCAALPEHLVESELFGHEQGAFTGAVKCKIGRIEQASGGTLFLDEIGDLPAAAQAKLLRVLQERVLERVGGTESIPVDVRLVAATNLDLEVAISKGVFRRDLYYRLNVIELTMPPLRERGEDVLLLAEHFLARAQLQMNKIGIHITSDGRQAMLRYAWPGNVRELENVCTRLAALSRSGVALGPKQLNLVTTEELHGSPVPIADLKHILEFCEREIIRRVLDRNGGNRSKTARLLGISRQNLYVKLGKDAEEIDQVVPEQESA